MAEVLSSGTARSLEGLDASCNSIGPAGASAISRSVSANSVLRALDLSANAIEVRQFFPRSSGAYSYNEDFWHRTSFDSSVSSGALLF